MTETSGPRIVEILTAERRGASMQPVPQARAIAGAGLAGDRYETGQGTFSARRALVDGARALSLIDTRDIARCSTRLARDFTGADLRRNIVVDGIDLLAWRGHRFALGEAIIRLVGRCAPCRVLSRYTGDDMRAGLYRGGGMRAVIETGGLIQVGQPVVRQD